MRRFLTAVAIVSLFWGATEWAQGFGGLPQNMKVNSFAQAGFLHMGSNMSLPIGSELINPDIGDLEIGTMDLTLQDANLWCGNVGFTAVASEIFSVSALAGGLLPRSFGSTGEIPVNLNGTGVSPTIEFTNTGLNTWYVQGGVGLGPILAGVYYNYFAMNFGDPRQGSVPLANQTLGGVLISKTTVPYIGVAIPAYGALGTILYSPLAWCNTTFDMRSAARTQSQLQYTWKKPGDFISTTLQYNTPMSGATSFGLWVNYTWLKVRGTAELEFVNAAPFIVRHKEVTATVTQYVIQGGVTLGYTF
jgi:hypothetical protein